VKELSPGALARIAGGLYLVNILAGAFAIGYVPAAVGNDVHGHELLFRAGLAAHVAVTATNVPLAVIFYELFKIVNRRAAMLVVLFTVVATAIEAAAIVSQLSALTLDPAGAAYDVSTVFFAFYALALGYLIYRSTFMPRVIGVLMTIDGVAYLINSFATILAPAFAAHLVPYIQLPVLLGEGSLTLWFLVFGINAARWQRLSLERGA
jgi:uncharacterized protein DUF4386